MRTGKKMGEGWVEAGMSAARATTWRPRRKHHGRHAVAGAPPPALDPDTVKTVADLAARAYADERDRFKAVDTRIGLLLSATSAVVALVVTLLIKPPDAIAHVPSHPHVMTGVLTWIYGRASAVYYCSIAVALASLIVALLYFIRAERQDEFPRLDLDYWVDRATLARPSSDVQAELAAPYRRAFEGYTEVTGKKLGHLRRGAVCLVVGVAVLVLAPVSIVILIDVVQ